MNDQGIGASVRRKEDSRFLTCAGNSTDDINQAPASPPCLARSRRSGSQAIRRWREVDSNARLPSAKWFSVISADKRFIAHCGQPIGLGRRARRGGVGRLPGRPAGRFRHSATVAAGGACDALRRGRGRRCASAERRCYKLLQAGREGGRLRHIFFDVGRDQLIAFLEPQGIPGIPPPQRYPILVAYRPPPASKSRSHCPSPRFAG